MGLSHIVTRINRYGDRMIEVRLSTDSWNSITLDPLSSG